MDNRRGNQDYGFDDDREYRRNRGWDYEESFGRQYEPDDRDEYGSYPGRQRSSSYRSERDDYLSSEGDFDRDRGYRRYNSYERYEGPTGSRSEPYSNYRESGPRTYNYRQSSESRSGYREGYQPQRRDESDYPDYERLRRNIPRPREEYDEKQFDDLRGYTGPKRYRDNERGEGRSWWDRMSDEVASWFGGHDSHRDREYLRSNGPHVGRGPKNYRRSDDRIREDINDRLTDHPLIDASDLEVTVQNAEVTLTGQVESRREKRLAEDIAEHVSGVSNVENRIRLRNQRQSEPYAAGTGLPDLSASNPEPVNEAQGNQPTRPTSGGKTRAATS